MLVSLPCLYQHWAIRGKTESGLWLSVLVLCFDFRPHGNPFTCFSAHFVHVCGLSWTVTLEISTCGVHLSLKIIALVVSSIFLYIHSCSFLSLSTPHTSSLNFYLKLSFLISSRFLYKGASHVAQSVKHLPVVWERPGLNTWVRKFPWRRKWQPTPVFLTGESRGQRSLAGYSS